MYFNDLNNNMKNNSDKKPLVIIQTYYERNRKEQQSSTKAAFHYFESGGGSGGGKTVNGVNGINGITNGGGGHNGVSGGTTETNHLEMRTESRLPNQPPPPPPPLPSETSSGTSKEFSISETIPSTHHIIGPPTPPDCPTPDYDSLSLVSSSAAGHTHNHGVGIGARGTGTGIMRGEDPRKKHSIVAKMNGVAGVNGVAKNPADLVEMQSIESFKLTNPASVKPKPPSTYFVPQVKIVPNSNHSSVSQRPSSTMNGKPAVTIREYPSSVNRKQPSRMEFLPKSGETNFPPGAEPSSRLQTELFQTLARSNLNKRFLEPKANGLEKSNGSSSNIVNGNKVTISINSQQPKCTVVDSGSNCKSNQNPFYLFPNKNKCLKTEELSDRFCNNVNISNNSSLHNGHSNIFVIDKSALKNGQANLKMNSKSNCDSNKNSVTFNFNSKRNGEFKSGSDSKNGNGLCSILKNGSATGTANVSKVQIKN